LLDKLFGGETLVNVLSKQTAMFAADITHQALQLSPFIIPDGKFA